MRYWLWMLALAVGLGGWGTRPAWAQQLQGEWVDQTEARIDRLRKVDLAVVVLDEAGRPAAGVPVRIRQRRHAFPFGVRLDEATFAEPAPPEVSPPPSPDGPPTADSPPDSPPSPQPSDPSADWRSRPLHRLLSSVLIERAGRWDRVSRSAQGTGWSRLERMAAWAEEAGLSIHLGPLVSSDPADLPPWTAALDRAALAAAVEDHLGQAVRRFGRRARQIDLYGPLLTHDAIEARLGPAMLRRMSQLAGQATAARSLRFRHALQGPDLNRMMGQATALREAFVPVDAVSVEARITGTVAQRPIAQALDWLATLRMPVTVCNLEVGGPSPAAAAVNLEILLRTLFAEQAVTGIYFAGLTADQLDDPAAALLDSQGGLTPAGEVFVGLVGRLWWTDQTPVTSELGEIRLRVFAGLYDLRADLGGGRIAEAQVYLAPGRGNEMRDLVVLQPLPAEPARKDAEDSPPAGPAAAPPGPRWLYVPAAEDSTP